MKAPQECICCTYSFIKFIVNFIIKVWENIVCRLCLHLVSEWDGFHQLLVFQCMNDVVLFAHLVSVKLMSILKKKLL